jgi:hypothetical protein
VGRSLRLASVRVVIYARCRSSQKAHAIRRWQEEERGPYVHRVVRLSGRESADRERANQGEGGAIGAKKTPRSRPENLNWLVIRYLPHEEAEVEVLYDLSAQN